MFTHWSVGNRWICVAATLALLLGLSATTLRIIKKYQTPGPPDGINEGYCDFHNGIYFPSLAFLRGVSPYGSEYAAEYPVARQIPFFSPSILAIHSPLSLLPLRVSEVLYFVIMVALIVAISWQSMAAAGLERRIDWLLAISAMIVFSRAGHITLFNGYFTFEMVLAVIVAIRYAESRPMIAALALVIVSAKPTYILPLGFLMLARGNIKSLAYGAVLSIATAAIALAWLGHHEGDGDVAKGVNAIRAQITEAQEIHNAEPNEIPRLSSTRIDIYAIYSKWADQIPSDLSHLYVMFAILAWPMSILFRRSMRDTDDGVAGLTGAIIITGMIVGLYRQSYDTLLLVPPLVGIAAARLDAWRRMGLWWRLALIFSMIFPLFNYFSTQIVLGRLNPSPEVFMVLTSVNGLTMTILLIALCIFARNSSSDAAGDGISGGSN